MPVDQISSRPAPKRSDGTKVVRYNEFIDAKIRTTRRTVKLVDLATSLVALAASVLAFLLVVAVAEHWLVPGGFSTTERTALFAILLVCVGYFAYRWLWPLVARAINPVYAARTIEQSSPALKNSLINLLLFRQRRSDISDAVYRTLEEQAAQRLTRVPVETAVDQSKLIRLGYVLVAVVAVFGLYKVFSPKDPLVSAERVLMPWADIVPASRVSIAAVTPGSVTISRGEFVDVSAEVRGLTDDDAVMLRYTTDDGQVDGKAIPMKPAGDGLRFSCRVTDEADGSQQVGLTRNVVYRLEAGDARSLDYAITVVTAPAILVERVDYDYPKYTGFVNRSVDGLGDIRAIEGTRVTVHARANGPIRIADIDFDADGRPDLRMTTAGDEAHASFELGFREGRQTPLHASYVLRFTNEESRTNHDPVKHAINVERDYDPEAAILAPKEKAIDARLDETVPIEVEARDPDFALSAVKLRGEVAGRDVLNESLLAREHRGRFTARYSLVPSAHGLQAGDILQYWVEAADNRTPKPNTVATEHKTIRIGSPKPAQQPPENQVARNDRQQKQGEKGQGGTAGEKEKADQQQGGAPGEQQKPGDNQRQGDKETKRQGESGESASADGKSDAKSGADNSAKNAQGSEKSGQDNKSGGKPDAGQQDKANQDKSDQQKSNGEQTGAGAAGSQSSKDAAPPDGARPDRVNPQPLSARQQQNQQPGETQKGEQQTKADDQKAPVSPEGDNDGEAFDRIQKQMQRDGQLKNGEQEKRDGKQTADQQQADKPQQGDKKTAKGEDEKGKQEQSKDKPESNSSPENITKPKDGESALAGGKNTTKPGETNQQPQPGQKDSDRKGADAKTGNNDTQEKTQNGDPQKQQQSPGGQTTTKGPAGAGKEQKPQGSPKSPSEMKPAEKRQQSGSSGESNKQDKQEPSAGSNGKRERDAQGDQGGDKTGGGEQSPGRKSPHQGTGSPGQHDSADKGKGESGEKGKGDNSPNAGKDAKSDHATGSAGKDKGEGSEQRDGTGDKQGGKAGGEKNAARDEKAAGQNGEKTAANESKPGAEQKPGEKSKDKEIGRQGDKEKQGTQAGDSAKKNGDTAKNPSGGSASGGGGQPGGAVNPQPTSTGVVPEGDEANLEYARKQTDLVLEKLSDQLNRKKVDDRLLKELGWTQEDLSRFVGRWRQRKDAAQRDDPAGEAAKRELDDALRSLGLHEGQLKQNAVKKDSMRDLKEGYRGPVPLEYQERLRVYNQGVSRAHRDAE